LQRHKEHLKAIRRGEVKQQDVVDFFTLKEKELEKLYHESKLRHSPDWDALRQLLTKCLEHHYGSLDKCIKVNKDQTEAALAFTEIKEIVDKYRDRI
jgi:uncharacterized protein